MIVIKHCLVHVDDAVIRKARFMSGNGRMQASRDKREKEKQTDNKTPHRNATSCICSPRQLRV